MQWTMWAVDYCCCEYVRLSNCPIKPPLFSFNVYFASLYTLTERGSNSGNIEIKLKVQSTFEPLYSFY